MRLRTIAAAAAFAAALAAAAGCGEPAVPDTATPGTAAAPGASGSSGTPAAPAGGTAPRVVRVAVTVTGGKPRTAHRRVKVPRGAVVEITVTGDTAEEFHLHGYDRELKITPGRPAVLRFTAGIPGVFEAELHRSGAPVLELRVG
ncbi:hypothetical protein SAMN05443665_103588 [Actinomadura meyerae]|uniref:Cupredoxin-like domain-containing protein n=1 Tax=Actinomadura meyerae TaxID=240840 RepID=A0A239N4T6_9ACTN|nr:hypothetical protein [Actinomadura meyerae]SNT49462.1 hypothetical protein SAMN05443665_103588 [Actinomadura meyerae]